MDTPHILLVDDDVALLQALPHMVALRFHGVQVDISDSAPGALDQIQEHDYDAIVSDIKMPGMDGLELLSKIQELRTHELLTSNEAMDALVRDLLDCSHIKSNELVLHAEHCNLAELCQEVLDVYTTGAGLTLTFEYNLEPVEVEVDRDRISQVLI